MKIVFFGSDNFAIAALEALVAKGYAISCVVTQPDRQKGRGLSLIPTPIQAAALRHNLKVYQPIKINTKESTEFLKKLEAGLFVVIAYGQILSQAILDIPKILAINVHASLLPKYRGAAPINWAVIKGEKTSGVTVIKMAKEMDAGPIILQQTCEITDEDTAITLENKLAQLGAKSLLEAVHLIEKNNYKLIAQDENKATLAPKLKKEDGAINWNSPADEIHNLVRGTSGWPGAFTYYKGKLLKIYRASVVATTTSLSPGEIVKVEQDGITVACAKDSLKIAELQIESKRRMTVKDFIVGHKIQAGERLGKK